MRILIDSNVFLYSAREPRRLSRRARLALEDPDVEVFVSAVTPWELSLGVVRGHLDLGTSLTEFYRRHVEYLGAKELQVTAEHGLATERFPYEVLKDPMDRILAGQSIVEGLPLVTSDRVIPKLGIDVIW